jgi:hypothetical protein
MPLEGFDPQWDDLPHYILGITREIWEDRGVASLHRYYGSDVIVRSAEGVNRGLAPVFAHTVGGLSAAPDLQILGQDVIWSEDGAGGYLSSHRSVILSTDAGGLHGPATGRKIAQRVVADCYCIANRITDEWLFFDSGGMVRQLGHHPRDWAQMLIAAEGGPGRARKPYGAADAVAGPYAGRGNDNPWGARHAALLKALAGADFAAIGRAYDRAVVLDLAGQPATTHGRAEADRFWLALFSAIPDARLEIQHVIGRADPLMPPRSAVRWALTGQHDGWGAFGAPTGADLHVWGMSHAEWGPGGLRREVVIYDEVQVWKQILLAAG